MNQPLVDEIVSAVLYEGYILYPYRPSSVKNRQRWSFGGIYPRAYSEAQGGSDAWSMQTQCVVLAREGAAIHVKVRFLHLLARSVERMGPDGIFHPVESMELAGQSYQSWQEAVEREVDLDDALILNDRGPSGAVDLVGSAPRTDFEKPDEAVRDAGPTPRRKAFNFSGMRDEQQLRDANGRTIGRVTREHQPIQGEMELSAVCKGDGLYVVTVRILNTTAMTGSVDISRDDALYRSFVSTHTILGVRGGEFASLTDPPEKARAAAEACCNIGCWPVLVGNPGECDTMLSSPIILYDYPQIAPESPGDLFDGTEIDEILTLRIMTLTDEEKRQAMAADPRVARMLARTDSLASGQLMNLHGAMREVAAANAYFGSGNGAESRPLAKEEHHA